MNSYKTKEIVIGKYKIKPVTSNFYNPSYYVCKEGLKERLYAFTAENEDDYTLNTTTAQLKEYIDTFRAKFEPRRIAKKGV